MLTDDGWPVGILRSWLLGLFRSLLFSLAAADDDSWRGAAAHDLGFPLWPSSVTQGGACALWYCSVVAIDSDSAVSVSVSTFQAVR